MRKHITNLYTKESLRNQGSGFGKDIEAACKKIFDLSKKHPKKMLPSKILKDLEKAVMNTLGVKLKIYSKEGMESPSVIVPRLTTPSVLLNAMPKGSTKGSGFSSDPRAENSIYLDEKLKLEPGFIDREKLHVSGVFSKATAPLYLYPTWIRWVVKDHRMLTAVFLHEVGHIFTGYSKLDYLATGNALINEALRQSDKDFKPIMMVTPNMDMSALSNIKDKEKYMDAVRVITHNYVVMATPHSLHHRSVGENLADNFVGRFEYGADLVRFLVSITDPSQYTTDSLFDPMIALAVSVLQPDGELASKARTKDFTTIELAQEARRHGVATYRIMRDRILLNLNAMSARVRNLEESLSKKDLHYMLDAYTLGYKTFKGLRNMPDEQFKISKLLRRGYVSSRLIEEIEVMSEFLLDNPLYITLAKLRNRK